VKRRIILESSHPMMVFELEYAGMELLGPGKILGESHLPVWQSMKS
jgi:hypothetical protein